MQQTLSRPALVPAEQTSSCPGGCIEILRRQWPQHIRPPWHSHMLVVWIANHSPRLSWPSKIGIGFCKASANSVSAGMKTAPEWICRLSCWDVLMTCRRGLSRFAAWPGNQCDGILTQCRPRVSFVIAGGNSLRSKQVFTICKHTFIKTTVEIVGVCHWLPVGKFFPRGAWHSRCRQKPSTFATYVRDLPGICAETLHVLVVSMFVGRDGGLRVPSLGRILPSSPPLRPETLRG